MLTRLNPTGHAFRRQWWLLPLAGMLLLTGRRGAAAGKTSDVLLSKHNLSVNGPGPVTSQQGDACMFCHTPHGSYADEPIEWNHVLSVQTYNTYTSSTYGAGAGTPAVGVSKLCLSCHDGTVAMGQTVSEGLISTIGSMRTESKVGASGDLTTDHPLGAQPVDDGQLALTLFNNPPTSGDPTVKLPNSRIECTSCHDPHKEDTDSVAKRFLVRSNRGGTLCLACHDPSRAQPNVLNGWTVSAHATSTNTVPTASFGPYGSVSTNACGNCHKQHGTGGASEARLLRAAEESTCNVCHAGSNVTPALRNVMGEFTKTYAHPTTTLSGLHDAGENVFPLNANRHAECADCHNPHAARATGGAASPPGVQAALLGVSGYDGGSPLRPAANEYQVCFKCHADSAGKPQSQAYSVYGRTPLRVTESLAADPYNKRLEFASSVARHNVTNPRQRTSTQVPSLRATILDLNGSATGRSLATGTYIYCTDCHNNHQARASNGTGPNGPHGSIQPHLLERRYEMEPPPATPGGSTSGVTYVAGISGTYALCYKCHDIDNSIVQGRSFKEHNKHISSERASCSTCHDPHGINGGNSTNNFSLVNFDLAVVGPSSSGILRIERTGSFTGRCYLRCHGANHNPKSY